MDKAADAWLGRIPNLLTLAVASSVPGATP